MSKGTEQPAAWPTGCTSGLELSSDDGGACGDGDDAANGGDGRTDGGGDGDNDGGGDGADGDDGTGPIALIQPPA